jgi:hypothetical protein
MDDILDDKKAGKGGQNFSCKYCDYNTCELSKFNRHKLTDKHKRMTKWLHLGVKKVEKAEKAEKAENDKKYDCICGSSYKYRQGLWKHKKICINFIKSEKSNCSQKTDKKEPFEISGLDANFLKFVLENNTENIKTIVMEVCKHIQPNNNMNNSYNTTTQNHNNCHNKTFNLQIFLNETCKDAMNLSDFINSIDLQLSDLESVGKLGFVNGISNILIKNLNAMDVTKRPVHCSDTKREVMYVKEDGKWEKDEEDNAKLRKAIKKLAFNNSKLLPVYRKTYPDSENPLSTKSDMYNKLLIEAYGGRYDDIINENKIIKYIVKETVIDKEQFAI